MDEPKKAKETTDLAVLNKIQNKTKNKDLPYLCKFKFFLLRVLVPNLVKMVHTVLRFICFCRIDF